MATPQGKKGKTTIAATPKGKKGKAPIVTIPKGRNGKAQVVAIPKGKKAIFPKDKNALKRLASALGKKPAMKDRATKRPEYPWGESDM